MGSSLEMDRVDGFGLDQERIRGDVLRFVCESTFVKIPTAGFAQIIDFRDIDERPDELGWFFRFCIEYFKAHCSASSHIFGTLEDSQLSDEHLVSLCGLSGQS
jgi:hypothetical protein